MSTKLSLGFAVLIALGAMSGCRQVTVVDFHYDGPDPEIDQLVVHAIGMKSPVFLGGLHETVGFYDLRPPVTIETWACSKHQIRLHGTYDYESNAERITVMLGISDGGPCPTPTHDGGLDHHDSGASGAGGGGGMTILPGSGGMAGPPDDGGQGGAAGSPGIGGATGTGGLTATGGVTGSGGSDGGFDGAAGECDDGGIHGTGGALGTCDQPPGDPAPGEIPTVTPTMNCINYCTQVFAPAGDAGILCPDLYTGVTQCQRYCTLAGWPTVNSLTDSGDTIDCRLKYLRSAQQNLQLRDVYCKSAGPGVKNDSLCSGASSMGTCAKLCDAWSQICTGSKADCMTACAGNETAAACRIPWLVLAADDLRYCPLVSLLAPVCLPPGC